MNAATLAPEIAPRQIKTRRVEFRYPEGELPHYYVNGDPVMSHATALLSAVFPEGEDFFVRSVRNYRDKITDAELKKQVGGFIGQESIRGREHRQFNQRLQKMGYQTWIVDRGVRYGLAIAARLLPKSFQLAMTAALEHYTAAMAEVLLANADAPAFQGSPEVSMFQWHALEESEHKAVAYDVFQTVSGKRWIRALVMDAITVGFVALVFFGTVASLLIDPHTYRHPRQVVRGLRALKTNPWVQRPVWRRLRDYNRKDFHPDDHDNAALTAEWRAKLFGDPTA
ncbi:MAG: metal-dependent hydrolase [Acidimicrobiales bacterium]